MFDAIFPKHWTTLQRLMWLKTNALARAVYETITGNPVSFTAKAAPLRKLKVAFSPVQSGSGDPSPDNVRPISGWSSLTVEQRGKNLCGGIQLANEIQAALPTATIDTTAKTVSYLHNAQQTGDTLINLPWKEKTRYTFILTVLNPSIARTNFRINYTDGSYDIIDLAEANVKTTVGFVTDENKTIDKVIRAGQGGTTNIYYDESGVFEGIHTIDDFVPYNGRSISINLGSTVYSGYVDVISGVVTVDQISGIIPKTAVTACWYDKDIGDGRTSIGFYTAGVDWWKTGLPTPTAGGGRFSYCKTGAVYNNNNAWNAQFLFTSSTTFNRFEIRLPLSVLSDYSDYGAALRSAMDYLEEHPLQAVYNVEPFEVQLTPQEVSSLLGENNMWSDANGDLTVEYRSN